MLYNGITTKKLDDLTSETCASLQTEHPDFGKLAARVAISNLQKSTEKSFSILIEKVV